MNEIIIPLIFNRTDFEEIYFRDNQASLFFSPTTKNKTFFIIILGLIFAIIYFNDLASLNSLGFYYIIGLIFLFSVFRLFVSVITTVRWKNGIVKYLNSLENNSFFELELTDNFLIVNIDYQEEYTQWKDFTKIEIKYDYIFLQSGSLNYLFPKKSMSEKDYNLLTKTLKENIK
ncbi:YcxB family protein [Chryseobacterium oryctis]|uniref:YcxB family protein n=1 Tax=Chryseobacterium oryctis TaxID=2952618 RepID=A0ABT3HIZ8_9FLAO|nr:YcxB family protein [Chryseobacterium oryctis]MCW3159756.1 YcxB family protein [Chryseobacterium oryctis]